MDLFDAESTIGLINEYWPRALDDSQVQGWARVLARTGAEFEPACQWIADQASALDRPPKLSELCTAVRPRTEPAPVEDSGPPVPMTRGRAWAAHVAAVGRRAAARRDEHDHAAGHGTCPVCSNPGDYRQCGDPTCPICATHGAASSPHRPV